MSYCIELVNCENPTATIRAAAAAVEELAPLAEALAPRTMETPEGPVVVEPTSAEMNGTRISLLVLAQEAPPEGEPLPPPRAVAIVDCDRSEDRGLVVDAALWLQRTTVEQDWYELPDGSRVVLDGPPLAETGAVPRMPRDERIAALEATAATLTPVSGSSDGEGGKPSKSKPDRRRRRA